MKFYLVVLSGLLIACSTTNSGNQGKNMYRIGSKATELGDRWNEGEEMVKEGQKIIQQSQIDKAKGENLVKKGTQIQNECERLFRDSVQNGFQPSQKNPFPN